MHRDSIGTWCEFFKNKHAIVVVISCVITLIAKFTIYVAIAISFDHLTICITQNYFRAIERIIDIISCATCIMSLIDLLITCTNISHDISFAFCSITIPCSNTTIVTQALLTTPLRIHRTVTSWLVSVEVTLNQITRISMTKHTIVTSIAIGGQGCSPKRNITTNIRRGIRRRLHTLGMNIIYVWLRCRTHTATISYIVTSICATIEIYRIVNCTSFTMCIRVHRYKIVCSPVLRLHSDYRQCFIVGTSSLFVGTTTCLARHLYSMSSSTKFIAQHKALP